MISTTDKKIYINSNLSSVNQTDDSSFLANLGTTITVKRLVLSSFTTDNLFCNFNGKWSDFSLELQNGTKVNLIVNYYLTRETIIDWLNNELSGYEVTVEDMSSGHFPSYNQMLYYEWS